MRWEEGEVKIHIGEGGVGDERLALMRAMSTW